MPDHILTLLLNFLTDRTQKVPVNGVISETLVSSTGSPQGCVLSPLLFILHTDSCRCLKEGSSIVKFLDDTALLTLQDTEADHGHALPDFVKWCEESFLDLNVSKTKELIDFRKQKAIVPASTIHGRDVEIVNGYNYLGTWFDSRLKFDTNTDMIVKKAHQRIYLLRRIRSFGVSKPILCSVYSSYIEMFSHSPSSVGSTIWL